jgi:hypothetical protein
MSALVPRERIEQTILLIRGHNVMLDSDLAQLYGVTVGRLNESVKRNVDRFPNDFMFQLTKAEFENLKSQIAISSSKWGGRRHAPYVFTEQGVAMLSSVLHSKRAIEVNIAIMRTFVRLREMISSNKALARRLSELEKKYDGQFQVVFEAIGELMAEPTPKSRRIGFKTEGTGKGRLDGLLCSCNVRSQNDAKEQADRFFLLAEPPR